jgi:hypothetical protein
MLVFSGPIKANDAQRWNSMSSFYPCLCQWMDGWERSEAVGGEQMVKTSRWPSEETVSFSMWPGQVTCDGG